MRKAKAAAALVVLILIIFSSLVYANDTQAPKTRIVEGKVVAIDWVASLLVVRRYQGISSDELNLTVPDSSKIIKGDSTIGLFDINIEDWVTVEFIDAGVNGLKVKSIYVKS